MVHRLHGAETAEKKASADAEFTDMQLTIKAEMSTRSRRLSDLWETPAMLKRTLVAVGVQVFGQFSGINGALRWIRAHTVYSRLVALGF